MPRHAERLPPEMPAPPRARRRARTQGARSTLPAAALFCLVSACRGDGVRPDEGADLDAAVPWDVADVPVPRPGMVWIPAGVLIAGTPPDRMPRVADEEMAGEQVVMRGYYIDVYPYPNEVGAIPTTDVTQDEAAARCAEQDKRLCTELEYERACKGAANTTYEYGDTYRAQVCATGTGRVLVPNGVSSACESSFGAHDLHGGAWSWTSSEWGRDGARPGFVTLRGGNGTAGELVGRCANARALRPSTRLEEVGFRCCAGEPNTFEVVLSVTRGEPLVWQPPDAKVAPGLEQLVPEEIQAAVRGQRGAEPFKIERMWTWRPLGNEELMLGGGCARAPERPLCGVVAGRRSAGVLTALAFVPTERWQPTIGLADSSRELFVYGGDDNGAFRKRVSYEWGRIAAGEKQRKKKRKGQKEPSF